MNGIGGTLVVEALRRRGIDTLFTLTGGHLFPVYDAWVKAGGKLLDVRHEATAAFAAEGAAKLTRKPQVAAVTAGPGVTNVISALASARFNGAPLLVIGGRAPQARWGQGSLQEMDHLPLVQGVVKRARTVLDPSQIPAEIDAALAEACTRPRGPVFIDIPLDIMFTPGQAPEDDAGLDIPSTAPADSDIAAVARALDEAERPVLVAGSDVYWDGAHDALAALAETARLPVVLNGMGRGLLPPDNPLLFSRARSMAFKQADLVLVAGTPLDFRLGFGQFGQAKVVHLQDSPERIATSVELAASASGDLAAVLDAVARSVTARPPASRQAWIDQLADKERQGREEEQALLGDDSEPIHPARVHGELRQILDPDAVVIGDGGDFVSFAGKYLQTSKPGRWMDPGPFGCLGTGLGYTIAARLTHPYSQVVLLAGDGALGFSLMDFDTLVRHELPAVIICGNNGSWGLEKHPMRQLFGHDAAADLRPGTRYDQVAEGLGGQGTLVRRPDELRPALERAFASGAPTLVNVLLDPAVAYPRRANLA